MKGTVEFPNPGAGEWTIRLNDNDQEGDEIAYASFTVSGFCVRITSGPDEKLCGIGDKNADNWAGGELQVRLKNIFSGNFHILNEF